MHCLEDKVIRIIVQDQAPQTRAESSLRRSLVDTWSLETRKYKLSVSSIAALKIYFLCSFDASFSFCNTLSYLSLKMLLLKLLTYSVVTYVTCATSFSFSNPLFSLCSSACSRESRSTCRPPQLASGVSRGLFFTVLNIHHPRLAHKDAGQSRKCEFPVTFKWHSK